MKETLSEREIMLYMLHIFGIINVYSKKGNKMTRRQLIKQRKQDIRNVILFCFASIPVIGFAMAYGHMLANGGAI